MINPVRGTQGAQLAVGAQGSRQDRTERRRRRETKPSNARSKRAAYEETGTKVRESPNGRARLTCVATKGKKEGGDPLPRSTRPRRPVRDQGETPKHGSAGPHREAKSRR